MKGHKWDYGPSCIKYEVDRGNASPYSGTYYVKCDAVNCCQAESHHARPDVKKWDIGQAGKLMGDKIVYLGKKTTTGLDNATNITADAWNESFNIPFTPDKAHYTYYITTTGNDTITHRIDYSALDQQGAILYGDFLPQHDLDTFRDVFKAPADCLKPNVLICSSAKVKEWDSKYFSRSVLH